MKMASEGSSPNTTYCLCAQPYDANIFMIQCDVCKDWFHGSCVGVREHQGIDVDKFHCPRCEPLCGPSHLKRRTNWHRHDYTELDADTKPVQTGTPIFIKELKSRHFASADSVILRLRGQQLPLLRLMEQGFSQPIVVETTEGLGLQVPNKGFGVLDVEHSVGSDYLLDVIDVCRQADLKMTMHEFAEYYNSNNRNRVFNCISLEFSKTPLSALIEAPSVARKLDWVNTAWPSNLPDDFPYKRPEVQKYCLMGVADSYTDFHIDFGGTSVWYHVLTGEKIFYIIEPTAANLSLYQRWMLSSNQSETFFADQVDRCYRLCLKQGQTLLVPTGWIHAVHTPVDSIVFGGNFLHNLNIAMQLQVYEIEKKIKIPDKYKFPSFETVHWFAGLQILKEVRELNDEGRKCPLHLLQGVKALVMAFKAWIQDKDSQKSRREEIPAVVQAGKLLKDLSKEIRHAEKFLIALNPPKPERESKRQKKKPLDKDFVDISQAHSLQSLEESLEKSPRLMLKSPKLGKSSPSLKMTLPKPPPMSGTGLWATRLDIPAKAEIKAEAEEDEGDGSAATRSDPLQFWKAASIGDGQPSLKVRLPKVQPAATKRSGGSQQSKTQHRRGIKLRVKNIKDVAQDLQKELGASVYEFQEDSDNERLMIDERPKKIKHGGDGPLKLRLSINGRTDVSPMPHSSEIEVAGEVDVVSSEGPKNGLEELLKATEYADVTGGDTRLAELDQTGRASPSTRDAIAGMLSISQAYLTNDNGPRRGGSGTDTPSPLSHHHHRHRHHGRHHRHRHHARHKKLGQLSTSSSPSTTTSASDFAEEENLVHQDEDYVYPSLEASDSDSDGYERRTFRPRGRRKMAEEDGAWNPKARAAPSIPRLERPVREGAKRQAVEKGLQAAARGGVVKKDILSGYGGGTKKAHRKRERVEIPLPEPQPGTSTASPLPPASMSVMAMKKPDFKAVSKRPKKGMATAKQRLGKILKIHKMIY